MKCVVFEDVYDVVHINITLFKYLHFSITAYTALQTVKMKRMNNSGCYMQLWKNTNI